MREIRTRSRGREGRAAARSASWSRRVPVLAGIPEIGLLVAVEVEIHGVDRDDGGEDRTLRRPSLHQIALRHQRIAHPAGNRRADLRPLQIEPGGLHRGLRGTDLGATLDLGAGPAVELLPRDRLHIDQGAGSLRFTLCQRRSRAGALQLRLHPSQLGLIRPRIDLEQDLALLHLSPFGEGHPSDVPGDPGADLHLIHRLEPAGELVPLGDCLLGHRGHRHRL